MAERYFGHQVLVVEAIRRFGTFASCRDAPARATVMVVMIHDFVLVELPAPAVKQAILTGLSLLADGAVNATASGERLRTRVGPGGTDALVAKKVSLQTGEPIVDGDVTTLPILWEAVGAPSLFPRMDGSLEIAPLGSSLTQLTFFGRYDAPLGRLGEGLDRLVLHRIAEHTVRAFLTEIGHRIASLHNV